MRRLLLFGFTLCWLPLAAMAQTFTTYMNGPNEYPGPGDPDGSGVAVVTIDGTTIHYTLVERDIGPTFVGAHIHEGPAGVEAGVVVGFSSNFMDGMVSGSVQGVSQALLDRMKANPAGFYVNVHTPQFPGGAIRGQLGEGCVTGDTTLCLNNNRFRIDVAWQVPDGQVGPGHAVKLTSDTGYLWFFNSDNVELVVKVLNACGPFPNQWVFSSGLTNVKVDMTVIDTQRGDLKRYQNPPDTAYQPIQDTSAFGCP